MKKNLLYTIGAIGLLLLAFCLGTETFASVKQVKTVAVISDVGHRNGTNYLICGAASDIIASDIVNRINYTGTMRAPLLGETMAQITTKSIPLYYVTFFNEYKYNYNVDFVNLKRVTKTIQADYFLMVTSGLDVQSGFLKDTWWNKLNIPGMDPVKPTYKLATLITLIDRKTYNILWQDMYVRDIEAHNYDLGIVQFSPSYSQLSKIRKYSRNLSEYVTNAIDKEINPRNYESSKPKSVEMKSKFLNEGTKFYYPSVNGEVVKQNIHQIKNDTQKKWHSFKREKQQKRYIENVRKMQEKEQNIIQNQKTVVPTVQKQPKTTVTEVNSVNKNKNQETGLFDSIKNNIDDVSNSLPAPREINDKYVIPANEIKEPKLILPDRNLPVNQNKSIDSSVIKEELKPATLKTPVEGAVQEIVKPEAVVAPIEKPENKTVEPVNEPLKKEYYDWNIKNKNLQKIGAYS